MLNKFRNLWYFMTTRSGRAMATVAENCELREQLRKRVIDETFITNIALRGGGIHMGLEGGAAQLLAELLAKTTWFAQAKLRLFVVGTGVGLLWVIQLANSLLGLGLAQYGVTPRSWSGLQGILWAPFIHAGWWHLVANTLSLTVLGWLASSRWTGFFLATLFSWIGAGVVAWLLGTSHSVHVGASGLLFGYAGFLLSRGWGESASWAHRFVALAVLVSYGASLLMGVLHVVPYVSWQSHLGGLLGGWLAGVVARRSITRLQAT